MKLLLVIVTVNSSVKTGNGNRTDVKNSAEPLTTCSSTST